MRLHRDEPEAGPWRPVDDDELVALLSGLLPDGRGVVLVDGRSGSGRTTFATRPADLVVGSSAAVRAPASTTVAPGPAVRTLRS